MIIQNSEIEYKNFVIGLCQHFDDDGKFYEAYYRRQNESLEFFTENNFWTSKKEAYANVKKTILNTNSKNFYE